MSKIDEIKARLEAMEPYIKASSIGDDIAYLLAEVERLRASFLEAAQKETEDASDERKSLEAHLAFYRAQCDRYRAALERIATPDELSIDALTVPWKDAINKRIEIARQALKKT